MKTKIALICFAAAICATAVFWHRSPVRTVSGPVLKSGEPPAPPLTNVVSLTPERASGRDRPGSSSPPVVVAEPEDNATALLARLTEGLASTDSESRDFALTNLLPALVLADWKAAGTFAETNTIEGMRETVLENVAKLLAARDSANAIAWARGLSHNDERETALTDVCLKLAEADPAGAVRTRESLLADYQSFDALEDLAMNWAQKDLAAALAWIAGLPKDVRRDQLIGRVAYVQSRTSPKEAADLVAAGMTSGDAQIEAAVSVLHQWGHQDLDAATRWAQSFPEGPFRDRALNELSGIANDQQQAGN